LFKDAINYRSAKEQCFTWRIFENLWRSNYYAYWFPESRSGIWIQWMQVQATKNTLAYVSTRFW